MDIVAEILEVVIQIAGFFNLIKERLLVANNLSLSLSLLTLNFLFLAQLLLMSIKSLPHANFVLFILKSTQEVSYTFINFLQL